MSTRVAELFCYKTPKNLESRPDCTLNVCVADEGRKGWLVFVHHPDQPSWNDPIEPFWVTDPDEAAKGGKTKSGKSVTEYESLHCVSPPCRSLLDQKSTGKPRGLASLISADRT